MNTHDIAPEAVFLCGVPGCGKSTFISEFLEKNSDKNFIVLSTDDIFEEWGKKKGLNYNQSFKAFDFKDVDKEYMRRFKKAVSDKRNLIVDQTNLTVKSRAKKLNLLSDDYVTSAIVFDVDPKVLKFQRDKRELETGKSIPEKVLKDMEASFVFPTKSEFDHVKVIKRGYE